MTKQTTIIVIGSLRVNKSFCFYFVFSSHLLPSQRHNSQGSLNSTGTHVSTRSYSESIRYMLIWAHHEKQGWIHLFLPPIWKRLIFFKKKELAPKGSSSFPFKVDPFSEGVWCTGKQAKWHTICLPITKTCLFKYIENFTTKNWKFSDKNSDIFFHISAQNIDGGYSLEPPHHGSNEYSQSMFWAE